MSTMPPRAELARWVHATILRICARHQPADPSHLMFHDNDNGSAAA